MSGNSRINADKSLSKLGELVKKAGVHLKSQEKAPDPPVSKVKDARPAACQFPDRTDDELFEEAMNDVIRASWRHDPHPQSKPEVRFEKDQGMEDLQLMQSAMDENSPITVLDHPEYIEGWIGVAGRRFAETPKRTLFDSGTDRPSWIQ